MDCSIISTLKNICFSEWTSVMHVLNMEISPFVETTLAKRWDSLLSVDGEAKTKFRQRRKKTFILVPHWLFLSLALVKGFHSVAYQLPDVGESYKCICVIVWESWASRIEVAKKKPRIFHSGVITIRSKFNWEPSLLVSNMCSARGWKTFKG